MPRVPEAQNTVGIATMTDAKLRPADFGAAGEMVGRAVEGLGNAGGEAAKQVDAYQDMAAHVEANRINLAHIESTREIGTTVNEALGANAGGTANQATTDLNNRTAQLLSAASPRARRLLEPIVGDRVAETIAGFRDHAFTQTRAAMIDTSKAVISSTVDAAVAEPDETRARALLAPIFHQNDVQAQALGWTPDVVKAQNQAAVSTFLESRAHLMGRSDPKAAIQYAADHRDELGEVGYERVVDSYLTSARGQESKSFLDLHPELLAGTAAYSGAPADPLAPLPDGASGGKLSAAQAWNFTAQHEGGYAAADANGHPVNYGINQKANPNVDVKTMSKAQAGQIFKQKYWDKSGAADLPAGLAAVHSDTFFINPERATEFLAQSGGDPQKYMELRAAWMARLVAKDPDKYGKYEKAWNNRNRDLRQFADSVGGNGPSGSAPSTAGMPLTTATVSDVTARIRAIPGLSYEAQESLITEAKSRIAEAHTSRSEVEDEAGRQAVSAIAKLDKNFTDMNQLPAAVLTSLNPSTFMSLQDRAQRNKETHDNAPPTPQMETLVNFTRLANPALFASPRFQQQLLNMGAPPSMIRQVAADAGTLAGQLASQKPDPISGSEIWTIAKPAFEASGIFLDTTESKGKNKAVEMQADAQRKNKAVGFLREMATTWATANPGKKPPEELIKGWVGQALRHNGPDTGDSARAFDHDAHDFNAAMTPQMRADATTALGRVGQLPTEGNLFAWYKAMLALHTSDQVRPTADPTNTQTKPPPHDPLGHTKQALREINAAANNVATFGHPHFFGVYPEDWTKK